MTYIPTDWKIGDTITANKLNNIESGIVNSGGGGGGGMVLTISRSGSDTVLDKNYNEIKGAFESGIIPIALNTNSDGITEFQLVTGYGFYEDEYFADLSPLQNLSSYMTFKSNAADGVLKLFE